MRFCSILIFFLYLSNLNAQQKEGAWWVLFNKIRINFNVSPPLLDTFANLTNSPQTYTLSNSSGDLLFYGNPPTNKFNQILPNSASIPTNFTINTLLTVKKPLSNNYGVFANASINAGLSVGLFYYEIDQNLNVVIGSFQQINFAPTIQFRNSSPTVLQHANGVDYWIVVHSQVGNTFISIPFNSAGIGTPQYYSFGGTLKSSSNISVNQSWLKSSSKSHLICITKLNGTVGDTSYFEIYDFNKQTGLPQNLFYQKMSIYGDDIPTKNVFSPNEKFIYQISLFSVSQFDLTSKNQGLINSSKYVIDTLPRFSPIYGDGSIAIDGKVYISSTQGTANVNMGFSVINCPNEDCPNCGFEKNKYLTLADTREFLPFQNQTFFRNADSLQAQAGGADRLCVGDSVRLSAYGAGCDSFFWYPSSGLSATNVSNPFAKPTQTTTYFVVGYKQCGVPDTACVTISVLPKLKPLILGIDTVFCEGDSGVIVLQNTAAYDSVFWSSGEKHLANIFPKSTAIISLTAIDTNGCITDTSNFIRTTKNLLPSKPILSIAQNDTICFGDTAVISVANTSQNHYYIWNSGDTAPSIFATNTATFFVSSIDQNACKRNSDTIYFFANSLPTKPNLVFAPNDSICAGDTVVISINNLSQNQNYLWSNGDTTLLVYVSSSSSLFVVTTDQNGCQSKSDTIDITQLPLPPTPILNVSPNDTICFGDTATLSIANLRPDFSYVWSDGSSSSALQSSSAGLLWVKVNDTHGCSSSSDTMRITDKIPAPIIMISGVDTFCDGDSIVLMPSIQQADYQYFWNTGDTSAAISIKIGGSYFLQAEDRFTRCKSPLSEAIAVTVNPIPNLSINVSDTLVCFGETALLEANSTDQNIRYRWSTGDTLSFINVISGGSYEVSTVNSFGCRSIASRFISQAKPINCMFSASPTNGSAPLAVNLQNLSSPSSFLWYLGDSVFSTLLSPELIIGQAGSYAIRLVCLNDNGCADTSSYQYVVVSDDLLFYVPNAFSPNGDGANDIWRVFGRGIRFFNVKIFNRFGEKVFESLDPEMGWDGSYKNEKLPTGVYVYELTISGFRDETFTKNKGSITIIH
jgi:gliding motility-associated-like protein